MENVIVVALIGLLERAQREDRWRDEGGQG